MTQEIYWLVALGVFVVGVVVIFREGLLWHKMNSAVEVVFELLLATFIASIVASSWPIGIIFYGCYMYGVRMFQDGRTGRGDLKDRTKERMMW